MLPVIDKPGIQYVVEEAVRAGLEDIVIVTGRGKVSLEDHFDRSLELEAHLESADKQSELRVVRQVAELAKIYYVRQKEPKGFGHAVLTAETHVGNEPFVVMVGDEIVPEPMDDETSLLHTMLSHFDERDASIIAVQEVNPEDVSGYGIIEGRRVADDLYQLDDMVEKPSQENAPSRLASRGRYVFSPAIFEILAQTQPGIDGEIQLTDAIRRLIKQEPVYAYVHRGPIFDVGKKLDFLKATIELALRRSDSARFKKYLLDTAARLNGHQSNNGHERPVT